jgi:AcrR family transcriptional regulator
VNTDETFATALRQLSAQRRFDEITIEDILQRAGYSRRTFYQHFRDKYDLLGYSYRQGLDALRKSDCRWPDIIASIFQLVHDDADFYTHVLQTDREHTLEDFFCAQNSAFIHDAIRRRDPVKYASDPDINFSIQFFCAGLSKSLLDWLQAGMPLPVAVIAQQVCDQMAPELRAILL